MIGWAVRHPMVTVMAVVSLAAAMAGPVWLIGWWLAIALVAGVVVGHPFLIGWLATSVAVAVLGGLAMIGVWWAWLTAVGVVWHWLWPASFDRQVTARARSWWRGVTVYSWRWNRVMRHARLTQDVDGLVVAPRRLAVRSTRWADHVTTELLPAQSPQDYEDRADALAASFGAEQCRVRRLDPDRHATDLVFRRGDPLAETVRPFRPVPVDELDLSAVPVGLTEWGATWRVPVANSHLLVAGSSDAGKGSVIGSLVNALAPASGNGLVELYGCDPKGGIEMSMYADLFTHLAWDTPDMVDLIEYTQSEMTKRNNRLRGHARRYTLSHSDPHKILIIDEFAFLTAYLGDRKTRDRVEQAVSVLLSQGRAPGYTVIGLLQDPRKDVIPMRDLFNVRITLWLMEGKDIVNAVLGDGSYEQGAYCDRISRDTPGVAYMRIGDQIERVRATWTDDTYLRNLASRYPAPHRNTGIPTTAHAATQPAGTPTVGFDDSDVDDLDVWNAA